MQIILRMTVFKRSVYTHLHQRAITEGRKMGRVAEIRKLVMYSASDKGCNKPGCRLQTLVNSRHPDSRLFQEDAIISRLVQNVYQ